MNDELANTIIERYQNALLETSHLISGIPESKLPCDQSLVKEAIKHFLSKTSKLDEKYMDLQLAYEKLAMFIPDMDAEKIAKAESAMMTMDPADEGFKYLADHGVIQQKIQDNMNTLTEELNDWIAQQPDIY